MSRPEYSPPWVSVPWLQAHQSHPGVKLLDSSWYLPAAKRDCHGEFLQGHIPGARFFDIDRISDAGSSLPHMLPPAHQFAAEMNRLGIGSNDLVVIYDSAGLFSAPRAWWMFRAFSHLHVAILEGGLPAWLAAGGDVESGEAPAPVAVTEAFRAVLDRTRVADLETVRRAVSSGESRILDARSAGRFFGTDAEPRAGLVSGHMPGALNLPVARVTDPERGTLVESHVIDSLLADLGVDSQDSLITSCGSGITACTLALALFVRGRDVAVYDGSWAEWGSISGLPVVCETEQSSG